MKHSATAAILLTAGLLAAQTPTGPRVGRIRAPAAGKVIVRVGPGPFNLHMAELGPGLTLDTSVSPYVLRVTAAPAIRTRVPYELAGPTAEFIIPEDFLPGSLLINVRGLLMTETNDYTLSGRTVQFVSGQVPGAGDIVNLRYFPVRP